MYLTNLDDGSLLIEYSLWRDFKAKWLAAPDASRVVTKDKRPAVLEPAVTGSLDPRPSLHTIHWHVWERVRNVQAMQTPEQPREKRCGACHEPMKEREYETYWKFHCPRCESNEIWSKTEIGGTIGSGEKEST